VSGTSSPYVTTIMATSTTGTSTFANAIIVGTPATTTLTYNQIGILASSTNNGIQFSTNYYSSSFSCGVSSVIGSDGLTYGTVVGADGNCWLDRNLGATEVATSFNDYNAYGSLFQWGRLADGHQSITWTGSGSGTAVHGTTATLSSTDNPGTNLFITISSGPYDWRSPQNDNLWQGVNGTNNPCPIGFRLPTQPEWANLVTAAGITNYTTAYSSSLKLTVAGYRLNTDGSLSDAGGYGGYWSSSVVGTLAYYLFFGSGGVDPAYNYDRGFGFSVRCLKDSGSIISPILLTSSWSLGSLISNNAFTIANSSLLNSLNYLSILTNGNVGIGTTTPATALDVNGDITTESVKSAPCLATDSTGKIVSTACGTGSGGGLATSSPWTVGNLAYVSSQGAVSSVGTSTLSASSPLTGSFTHVGSGGALGIQVANTSQGGYLSNTDWNTFNGKQAAGSYLTTVTADSPLGGSGTSGSHLTCGTCNTTNASVSSVGLSSANSTLTIGSTPVTTSGTITADLNLGNANSWTGKQTFVNASTSALTVGGTATVTNLNATGTLAVTSTSTLSGNTVIGGQITSYNGGSILDIPTVVTKGKAIASTTVGDIINYAVPSDGMYFLSYYFVVSSISVDTIRAQFKFTDPQSNSEYFVGSTVATTGANAGFSGAFALKGGTNLTGGTELVVSGGSVTYNMSIVITRLTSI